MPFTLDLSEDGHIVLIKNTGELNYERVKQVSIEALSFAERNNVRLFLSDCTAITNPIGIFDAYKVPDLYNEIRTRKGGNKLAILLHRDVVMTPDVSFFETVCVNRGHLVKVFNDRAKAMEWLLA